MGEMKQTTQILGEVPVYKDGIPVNVVETGRQIFGEPCLDCEESGRRRRAGEYDDDHETPLDEIIVR